MWNYVNTKDNPADIASRGMYLDDLCKNDLWWREPKFLHGKQDWPHHFKCASNVKVPELRNKYIVSICNSSCKPLQIFERFLSLIKLKRVFAYVLRFIRNSRNREQKKTGQLTVIELENSMICLSKLAQNDCYLDEITIIKSKKELSKKSRLVYLNPFIHSDGLLRVGGRLKNLSLSFDTKHPILLDGKQKFSKLIFLSEHIRLLHPGPQLLLFSVFFDSNQNQQIQLWIEVVLNSRPLHPMSSDPNDLTPLTSSHLLIGKVLITPPDPLINDVKTNRLSRFQMLQQINQSFWKRWSSSTYQIAPSRSTTVTFFSKTKFLGNVRNETRRGTPSHLYSDNATNFVASQKELIKFYNFLQNSENQLIALCSKENITWHFIPPNSPNFGGLWESNIKVIKNHLYKVIGDSVLTYEEYLTLLYVQIEAVLNSRPLHPMSSDPNDLTPLTPSHLLIGKLLITPPDPLLNDVKTNRLSIF
ncbi:hypothetical protein HUJ04_011260 [Dendroctonus ponderosae]|nr:hypothetical protein HUJ04_011260 [Dendroctonus ponderosae]